MGWFNKTLLGQMVLPFDKKVRDYLKEGYEYDVSPHLAEVFTAFCDEQHASGLDHDMTSVLFMAVVINSLEPDGDIETEKFVYHKNAATIGGLPYHTKQQNRSLPWEEIKEIYIEASSKHLPEWIIEELWSEENNNSLLLMMFDEIKEKNMEKLNDYFGF
jgi:hypothetical protein